MVTSEPAPAGCRLMGLVIGGVLLTMRYTLTAETLRSAGQ
ncbi:hypothetical protein FHR32_001351 [Streptosporangium album]|uniref:Uncharacterized protein n=1 Tax=Streptosporangium album TaxID=47479 RepID=A0A7W7RT71_9ACTN|nr:hypothetical protein [Streptosporangium album]